MTSFLPRRRAGPALLFACVLLANLAWSARAAESSAKKSYDLPSGPASVTLKQFVAQSGVQLLYAAHEVSAVKTNAVIGEFTAAAAINRMLATTGVIAVETKNGAIAVKRAADPNGWRAAPKTAGDRPTKQFNPTPTSHQNP
ncbi:MAG: STN domain-containing protein [Opitutaceae bacterium]|nr:STN domain-containing protein [Opitutaceae bacterium]